MQDISMHTTPPCDHLEVSMDKENSADTPTQSAPAPESSPSPKAAGDAKEEPTTPNGDCCNQRPPQEVTMVAGARKRKSGKTVRHQMTELDSPDSPRYQCPMCSESVASQTELSRHLRAHTDQQGKLYICRVCDKALSSSSSLDRHLLVHTGEKPFKCQTCGMAFSTNGNMHRHTRTHAHRDKERELRAESSSSDGGQQEAVVTTPSKRRRLIPPRATSNKAEVEDIEEEEEDEEEDEGLQCPMCNKDFPSNYSMENHLEEMHPDYEVKCTECQLAFKNHRALNLHSFMVHFKKGKGRSGNSSNGSHQPHQTVGFNDLTFVDFSTAKFPLIARALCERSLHKPISPLHRFQCEFCSRAFPCGSALEIHRKNHHHNHHHSESEGDFTDGPEECDKCEQVFPSPEDLRQHTLRCHSQNGKEGFFAVLDLQNKSDEEKASSEADTGASSVAGVGGDLADIQSILNVTSRPTFLPDFTKSSSPPPTMTATASQAVPSTTTTSSLSSAATSPVSNRESPLMQATGGATTASEGDEEDPFSADLREMKLRGEFPCRLCGAIFPNLRALKGHNRTHLSGAPYLCNMCDYRSNDKSTLIRHMRVHNGERPFECAVCNYAFTTKANCERHLRNRHGKASREEVRSSIIFHPTSDGTSTVSPPPSNGTISAPCEDTICKLCRTDFKLNCVLQEHMRSHHPEVPRLSYRCRLCRLSFATRNSVLRHSLREHPEHGKDPSVVEEEEGGMAQENGYHHSEENLGDETYDEEDEDYQVDDAMSNGKESDLPSVEALVNFSRTTQAFNIDLNMEVLDLSRKRSVPSDEQEGDQDEPQDLSVKKTSVTTRPTSPLPQPAKELDEAKRPRLDGLGSTAPFPTPPALFFSSPFQSRSSFPLLVPLFPPTAAAVSLALSQVETPEPANQHQQMTTRGLQLSAGGSLVSEGTPPPFSLHFPSAGSPPRPSSASSSNTTGEQLHQIAPPPPPPPPPMSSAPSKSSDDGVVKMVIKNGVLMKKQKQRRYRTERPFGCEFCSARFTLRSNMERHIKQQHPEHWSKRPRGARRLGSGRQGASNAGAASSSTTPTAASTPPLESEDTRSGENCVSTTISEEVRQQLKHKLNLDAVKTEAPSDDDDDDDAEGGASEAPTGASSRVKREPTDERMRGEHRVKGKDEEGGVDLVSVSRLLDNANTHNFQQFFKGEEEEDQHDSSSRIEDGDIEDDDSEGGTIKQKSCSSSEDGHSGSKAESTTSTTASTAANATTTATEPVVVKKKSAYSSAPHKVSCPYCLRKFPWTSSLHRHILTHTGQKPFKCPKCSLWFTTKSNRDRHLQRKHRNNSTSNSGGDASYTMRNVPERPYKCSLCPSSTFSTLSNLKKHQASRHRNGSGGRRSNSPIDDGGSDEEFMMSKEEEESPPTMVSTTSTIHPIKMSAASSTASDDEGGSFSCYKCSQSFPSLQKLNSHLEQHSDLPFKCHLCDDSYAERSEALDHIRVRHQAEYEVLVAKGALDASSEDNNPGQESHIQQQEDGHGQSLRGRFPDYANRKVTCAFCLRRFWSAEDLRRHMRTHTGERPFSCSVCSRKFTLKHSMLRHRKKHQEASGGDVVSTNTHSDDSMDGTTSGGEEPTTNGGSDALRLKKRDNLMDKISRLSAASALSGARWGKDYAKLPTITPLDPTRGDNGIGIADSSDLIGNLLGIPDKEIVDQLISRPAGDAAKLLGLRTKD